MRKFAIVLLAVVLVLGMSSGVMAVSDNLEDEDVSDTVDFDIDVDPMAKIELPDSVNLTLEELQGPNVTENFDVTVEANTAVNTRVRMEFSNFSDVFPDMNKDEVLWESGEAFDSDEWIISPNIAFNYNEDIDDFADNIEGWDNLRDGRALNTLSTNENSSVTDTLKFETNINDNAEWYEFEADEDEPLEGNLVFTVSAVDSE